MSDSVADQFDTEKRIASMPWKVVPLMDAVPSSRTRGTTWRVVLSSKATMIWFSTTSFTTCAAGISTTPSAKRRASRQHRSTRSARPL
jgi:hypothetical protein